MMFSRSSPIAEPGLVKFDQKSPRKGSATLQIILLLGLVMLTTGHSIAATLYVWQGSPNPNVPFTNWNTAAHNIQDAVDAAQAGDLVLVTNGVYRAGGRVVAGALKNRIAITNAIEVRSVNGPGVTSVDGAGLETGDQIIRCAYVADGAVLSGFYLYYGTTMTNGDRLSEQSGGGVWCADSGLVTNCSIFNCSANEQGGGAYGGNLSNCTLGGNGARNGGGVAQSRVLNCVLNGNSAGAEGGGGYDAIFSQCTLGGNSDSPYRGGNSAYNGGGCSYSTLTNCLVIGNSLSFGSGAGAANSTLVNSTVTLNSAAAGEGGGVSSSILYNCIVYYNSAQADPNHHLSTFFYCCTTPEPSAGDGNIADEPGFVDFPGGDLHLRPGSPCIDTGIELDVTNDFEGNPRPLDGDGDSLARTDMGAYEFRFHPIPTHYVRFDSPSPFAPYTNWDTAAHTIQDAVDASQAGDLVLVTNGTYATGYGLVGAQAIGFFTNRVLINKAITVASVNGPAFTTIQGAADPLGKLGNGAIRCAYVGYGAVLSGFTLTNGHTTSFTGAGLTGNDAGGGALCEVTGVVTNCILTNNFAYYGGGGSGGIFYHCTMAGNQAEEKGGGNYGGAFYGCTIVGNSAPWGGAGGFLGSYYDCLITHNVGDGIDGGSIYNCRVVSNSGSGISQVTAYNSLVASNIGDGASSGSIYNCTVVSNSGAGIRLTTAYNSIIWGNSPDIYGWYDTATFWCITPSPIGGVGSLTNAPSFVNAAQGDFRLRFGSAGIDAGTNLSGIVTNDLDGKVRPLDGNLSGTPAFDIGAYEYDPQTADSNSDGIPDWWTLGYGLDPNDPQVATSDPDNDGVTTFNEWIADTNPTNKSSYFLISNVSSGPPVRIGFQSSSSRQYTLFYCTNLNVGNLSSEAWVPVPGQTGVLGNGAYQFLTDSNATTSRFYRLGVELTK